MTHPTIRQACESLGIVNLIEVAQIEFLPGQDEIRFPSAIVPKDRSFSVAGRIDQYWEVLIPICKWSQNHGVFFAYTPPQWTHSILLVASEAAIANYPTATL